MSDPFGVLEVKCPASGKDIPLKQLCNNSNFFLTMDNNHLKLKRKHNYYYQVQEQMHITNRIWYDFVVWTPRESELHVERIFYDSHLWEQTIYPKLQKFYFTSMLLELASPRYPSRKKVQDTLDTEVYTC